VLKMIRDGLLSFRVPGAPVATLVLTGPAFPWDRSRCTHAADEKCSGVKGCRHDERDVLAWNLEAPRRWRRLNERVMQDVRRRFGHGTCRLLVRWWEFQRRGVLHLHLDLPYATLREKRAADFYALRLHAYLRVDRKMTWREVMFYLRVGPYARPVAVVQ
jgi:hypothetical protein